MTHYVCMACGTSFPSTETPPDKCPICADDRQFVPLAGQSWTTVEQLDGDYRALIAYDGPFLGIGISPHFAIGQRALLVRTASGNVLWDCIPFLDDALIDIVGALGGLAAIAVSHPHFYGGMERWAAAFGSVPVFCHEADRSFAQNPGPTTRFWMGEKERLLPGLTLVRCGGHFAGSTVLHVDAGAAGNGHGALLTGDTLQVTPGGTHVSFMRSYPNLIPLSGARVRKIEQAVEGLEFDTIIGGFWERRIESEGRRALAASVERYVAWLSDDTATPHSG